MKIAKVETALVRIPYRHGGPPTIDFVTLRNEIDIRVEPAA